MNCTLKLAPPFLPISHGSSMDALTVKSNWISGPTSLIDISSKSNEPRVYAGSVGYVYLPVPSSSPLGSFNVTEKASAADAVQHNSATVSGNVRRMGASKRQP